MDSQSEKKHLVENERKGIGKREGLHLSSDDDFAFVPVENIRIIERAIRNLEEVMLRLNIIKSMEN